MLHDLVGCEVVSLKDSSGGHERPGSRPGKTFSVRRHMVLDCWDSILLDSKSKAKLIECVFEVWSEIDRKTLPFPVYLSGGFSDRTKVVKLKPENIAHGGSSFTADLSCTHEEADTRVVFYAAFCVKTGCSDVIIEANDTDIVVILLQSFSKIEAQNHWNTKHLGLL
jgi:hypothetical protein